MFVYVLQFKKYMVWALVRFILCFPQLLMAYYAFRFLQKDEEKSRQLLTFAMVICTFSTISFVILFFVQTIVD